MASDLVDGDTNGTWDVFLRDMSSSLITLVSRTPSGKCGNGASQLRSLTPDGRFVLFESEATDLVGGISNRIWQVYRYDRQSGTIQLVSINQAMSAGNGPSFAGSISDNGRYVCFNSEATNLIPTAPYCFPQAYLRDMAVGTTKLLSLPEAVGHSGPAFSSSMTEDGEWVTFTSLTWGNTTSFAPQVIRYDHRAGVYEIASVSSSGSVGNARSTGAIGVYSNRLLGMRTEASNLATNDTNSRVDVILYDLSGTSRFRIAGNVGIPYALVTASGPGNVTVQADASGNYLFSGLAAGVWTIQATAQGYDFTSLQVNLRGNDATAANLVATPSKAHLTVSTSGVISTPAEGQHEYAVGTMLTVTATPSAQDEDIRFVPIGWMGTGSVPSTGSGNICKCQLLQESQITWLTTNEYRVTVAWGITDSTWGIATNWLRPHQSLYLEMPAMSGYSFVGWYCNGALITNGTMLNMVVSNASTLAAYYAPVSGVSVRGNTLAPGAEVAFSGAITGAVISDSAGFYAITNLLVGTYTLTASKPGFSFSDSPRQVSYSGVEMTQDFTPSLIPGMYSLAGSCMVSGAMIIVSGPVATNVYSSSNGVFSVGPVPNGSYTVSVSRTGYGFEPGTNTVFVNNSSVLGVLIQPHVTAPQLTPSSGGYPFPLLVAITGTASEATLYCTFDKSVPSTNSLVVPGSVHVQTDCTVNVIAFIPGLPSSPVASAIYFADNDSDQMPDSWENTQGIASNRDDRLEDPDLDGANNWEEWIAGTEPRNPDSVFKFNERPLPDSGSVVLRWTSSSNRFYTVCRTTNLSLGASGFVIIPAASNLPAYLPVNSFTDTLQGARTYFYKIEVRK